MSRRTVPIDKYVSDTMEDFLAALQESGDFRMVFADDDVAALRAQTQSIHAELTQLRAAFTRRTIDLRAYQEASAQWAAELEEAEERLRLRLSSSPLVRLIDAPDVRMAWRDAALDRQRAVLDMFFTVTLLPVRPGRQPGGGFFSTESVQIKPKWEQS